MDNKLIETVKYEFIFFVIFRNLDLLNEEFNFNGFDQSTS